MREPKLIGLPAQETPPELKTSPDRRRQFPLDLLRQASRRLQVLALVGSVLWILGPSLAHLALYLTHPENPRWGQFGTTDAICAAAMSISLALYLYLRFRPREHNQAFVMDLALLYMVACAAAAGFMFHFWWPTTGIPIDPNPIMTWVGAIILIFAGLVPASPGKVLIAGSVAASMDPLGMIIADHVGAYDYGPLRNAFIMHYPNYLLLGVAVVISHVITRMGRQMVKEREMGSYRLGERLGQGGMGEVYLATHRMLARPAAIKLIKPEMLNAHDSREASVAVARFRREADAAAKLRSPHTVELYDFGVTEDGILYFVMELLEGMDLESLVRQEGPLPQKRVIHILRQVCESLEEAHASGLVHRDIKPANIHVGKLGLRHDFVKVLDFGLVKSVAGPPGEDSMATATGITPGTPAYMAPEIALGESVDGRADLYALGCVAYYLLTGGLVFEASTALQLMAKHIQEKPAPPSRRTELDVSPELDRVVLACLAKKADHRPQSAAELDRKLGEIEVEPWSEDDATRWWRAHQPA